MHKKGGEVYFKATWVLCYVAAGQRQQSYSNLPAQGPRGLFCCPAVLWMGDAGSPAWRLRVTLEASQPLRGGDACLGGCEG